MKNKIVISHSFLEESIRFLQGSMLRSEQGVNFYIYFSTFFLLKFLDHSNYKPKYIWNSLQRSSWDTASTSVFTMQYQLR